MWYRYEITVPANTLEAAPERHEIGIPAGVIKGIRIRFPPGPRGMVSVAVFQGNHKMWPRGYELPVVVPDRPGPPAWFVGDNEWVEWPEHVRNIEGWHWFLVGFSPGTTYQHVVYVDISIIEKEFAEPYTAVQELVEAFKQLVGI